ncbi:uncharacterized protein PGTG_22149 [Puccinia graminis f. sp. tritici CRL 75-36-700-3]|uniref:Uncharacterized protein n=1 Tax=Puccinia graminis f. sp. tritici (strain CRL 75-36-700-3 / race SCCL) TaxID=418459 RepID=H6QTQ4_PUCGT|nr:uncharacterized protein PGTG_22149 [Puccinia graminis f. sp. tritici CRL 75-36-700-3]EHS64269.1 hypothetical protein PGTG_22149 [Puccinia graminis f. sp. tritici CRL 75-36-700-3]
MVSTTSLQVLGGGQQAFFALKSNTGRESAAKTTRNNRVSSSDSVHPTLCTPGSWQCQRADEAMCRVPKGYAFEQLYTTAFYERGSFGPLTSHCSSLAYETL